MANVRFAGLMITPEFFVSTAFTARIIHVSSESVSLNTRERSLPGIRIDMNSGTARDALTGMPRSSHQDPDRANRVMRET